MSRFPKKSQIATNKSKTGQSKLQVLITEAKRQQELRETTYRDRALKLFPWVCARCGQEFSGKRLKELTVHHKDHNHDNNPPDGSNWELLCERCHDKEHARYLEERESGEFSDGTELEAIIVNTPFIELETLLKDKK
ncbi:MAG: YajD family HNH nuclease [Desulfomonilaceae bacterium]|jgi:5-methylcytosine-specific restriction endonuclease McrA